MMDYNLIALPTNLDSDEVIHPELPGFTSLGLRASFVYCHGRAELNNIWDVPSIYQKGEVWPKERGTYPILLYYVDGSFVPATLFLKRATVSQSGLIADNSDILGYEQAKQWYYS